MRRRPPVTYGVRRTYESELTETTVGERVAAFRRQRGLSQRDLAAEMKRSESWVSQVERDIQPIERIGVLRDLAAALGVSVHTSQ